MYSLSELYAESERLYAHVGLAAGRTTSALARPISTCLDGSVPDS